MYMHMYVYIYIYIHIIETDICFWTHMYTPSSKHLFVINHAKSLFGSTATDNSTFLSTWHPPHF